MFPNDEITIAEILAYYERDALDHLRPQAAPLEALLDRHSLLGVEGISVVDSEFFASYWTKRFTEILVGSWTSGLPVSLVLAGSPKNTQVLVGLGKPRSTLLSLSSAFPGIRLGKIPAHDMGTRLRTNFEHSSLVTGIPHQKGAEDSQYDGSTLDSVVRGMQGAVWGYAVQCFPRPREMVHDARTKVINYLSAVASMSRRSIQETTQSGEKVTEHKTLSATNTVSGEYVNWGADHLLELLKHELSRSTEALHLGSWQVEIRLGAATVDDLARLEGLVSSALSGENSLPETIRVHRCQRTGVPTNEFHTYLTSAELAVAFQFPAEEFPGYAIHEFARFDVDCASKPSHNSVVIGQITQDGTPTGTDYAISSDDLTKHGLVVGVTGSGKTTTLIVLLTSIHSAHIPFWIIEPAKTEYRALLGTIKDGKATGIVPELRVFTLGSEMIAPFRLNPFEFETDSTPGSVSILSHIDHLKAVFNAAFVLYPPMPYVLEMALHEIYEDKGWDLATGINLRLPEKSWRDRAKFNIFPTLTDLYRKIDPIVKRLGYDSRIEQDVRAGLKTRIGSLRIGAKGLMLDIPRGISMDDLLAQPTVFELENIGNDDEKTFLMGLLLAKLYAYRRLQAASGKQSEGLQHVMIIEEAHRLLMNVLTMGSSDTANPRTQAVSTFTNMLAEIRAYGQSVLVAEQIPSKLVSDVVKNTNLKVVHRLVAEDDRESLAGAMNMNEAQMRYLTTLPPGAAAVFAEGDDHPLLVQAADMRGRFRLITPTDEQVREVSVNYLALQSCNRLSNFGEYGVRLTSHGAPEAFSYQTAGRLIELDQGRRWATLLLRLLFEPGEALESMESMQRFVFAETIHLTPARQDVILRLFWVRGAAEILDEWAAEIGWSYPRCEEMITALVSGLIKALERGTLAENPGLQTFVNLHEQHSVRTVGPFLGCISCRAVCLYYLETRRLMGKAEISLLKASVENPTHKTNLQRFGEVSRILLSMSERWLGKSGGYAQDIAYCAGLQMVSALGYNESEQETFGEHLAVHLLPPPH